MLRAKEEKKVTGVVRYEGTLKKIIDYEKEITQYLAIFKGLIRDKNGIVQYIVALKKILQCMDMACLLLSGQYKKDPFVFINFFSPSLMTCGKMLADILVELAEKRVMFSQSLPSFFYKLGEVKKQENTDGERLDSSSKAGEVEPVVQKTLRA